jgi:hypothetical protein
VPFKCQILLGRGGDGVSATVMEEGVAQQCLVSTEKATGGVRRWHETGRPAMVAAASSRRKTPGWVGVGPQGQMGQLPCWASATRGEG